MWLHVVDKAARLPWLLEFCPRVLHALWKAINRLKISHRTLYYARGLYIYIDGIWYVLLLLPLNRKWSRISRLRWCMSPFNRKWLSRLHKKPIKCRHIGIAIAITSAIVLRPKNRPVVNLLNKIEPFCLEAKYKVQQAGADAPSWRPRLHLVPPCSLFPSFPFPDTLRRSHFHLYFVTCYNTL